MFFFVRGTKPIVHPTINRHLILSKIRYKMQILLSSSLQMLQLLCWQPLFLLCGRKLQAQFGKAGPTLARDQTALPQKTLCLRTAARPRHLGKGVRTDLRRCREPLNILLLGNIPKHYMRADFFLLSSLTHFLVLQKYGFTLYEETYK